MSETTHAQGGDASVVRPWVDQSYLERTLRAKLSVARTTITKADESIPKLAKAKSYGDAGRWQERRTVAVNEEKETLRLLDLYQKEFHGASEPSPSDAAACSALSWLDENASELIAETWPIADTGDHDSQWVVYQHEGYPGGAPKRIAIGWGQTPLAAIQDAMKGPGDSTKVGYIPPEFREPNDSTDTGP